MALLVVATLPALLLALLAVPLTVAFRFRGVRDARGRLSVRWLFGLVRFRVGIPGPARSGPARPGRPPKKPRGRRTRGSARRVLDVLGRSPFRRRVARLVRDLLRAVHVHDLRLRLRIGLGDPADTGCLWAILGPVAAVAAGLRAADVRIEPEFLDPALEIEGRGAFRLVPLRLVALAVAFALSPATVRALSGLRQGGA